MSTHGEVIDAAARAPAEQGPPPCTLCVNAEGNGGGVWLCVRARTYTRSLVTGEWQRHPVPTCAEQRESWMPWNCGYGARHFQLKRDVAPQGLPPAHPQG